MALRDGERQVAAELSGIRRDHLARYQWAAAQLSRNDTVIDAGCGIGYGASILAAAASEVYAFDRDAQSIAFGGQHYNRANIVWGCGDAADATLYAPAAAGVAFEIIEHLADPRPMLRSLYASGCQTLFASVPNEKVFPFKGYAFHHRHYTREEFEALLRECGWVVAEWWGQLGPESDVERNVEGRTLVVKANRAVHAIASVPRAELKPVPDHVAIVGLGPSCASFFELTRRLGGVSAYCDEVWGINAIGDVLRCDRVFHMDDVAVQELRAAAKPDTNIAAMVRWLKTHPGPVYTSVVREGYPGLVAFPLEDVLNRNAETNGGAPYFNSTAAYAVAFAVHLGVKRISLFGIDYTLPDRHKGEKGRACVEFWLGIAAARGIQLTVPDTSTVLDACAKEEERLYGYDGVDVVLRDREDGTVAVTMTPRALPTAEDIEHRYDHTRHPNRLVEAGRG